MNCTSLNEIIKCIVAILLLSLCTSCHIRDSQQKKESKKYIRQTEIPAEIITEEMIDTTSDLELSDLIYDNLSLKIYFNKDQEKGLETFSSFSNTRQTVYLIRNMETKFENMGFNNYYWHLDGHKLAKLLPAAFEAIKAPQCARLIDTLNEMYDDHEIEILKFKDSTTEGFVKYFMKYPLEEFNKKFLRIYETEQVPIKLVEFIRANKIDFIDE